MSFADFQVKLCIQRMCLDWDSAGDKLRKALTYKDAVMLHTSCGMFIHFMNQFQSRCPASEFPTFKSKLDEVFMAGLLDHELRSAAENSVYPGDVASIGSFRQGV